MSKKHVNTSASRHRYWEKVKNFAESERASVGGISYTLYTRYSIKLNHFIFTTDFYSILKISFLNNWTDITIIFIIVSVYLRPRFVRPRSTHR